MLTLDNSIIFFIFFECTPCNKLDKKIKKNYYLVGGIMINVVYLTYYDKERNYDINIVKEFISTYDKYKAGIEHKFNIISKNWVQNSKENEELKEIAKVHDAEIMELPNDGLD